MELDSRKKSRRDKIMRVKSFDTLEVREIDRKKAQESRAFPILGMGIIEDVFQTEGKRSLGKIKNVKKKIHTRARKMQYKG